MAAVDFTEFLPDIMPEVADCTESLAVNAIRITTHRLCSFAPVWQHVSAPFSVSAGAYEFPLLSVGQVPTYADVVRVMAPILVNGGEREVWPTPRTNLERSSFSWSKQTGSWVETYYIEDVRTLRIAPIPDSTNTDQLTLRLWLRPLIGATQVDEVLLNEYRTAVADGAKYRLMAMARQPWSDPVNAIYYGRMFNKALTDAYARVYKSYTEGDLSVQMRPLA